MEINLQETDYCQFNIHYEASAEEIDLKRTEVLNLFKNAPVSGFRKGRASLDAIQHVYRKQIDDSLKRALLEEAFHNTIFEKNLKPYGTPDFLNSSLSKDKFFCDFQLKVKPNFELAPYKGLDIPRPASTLSAERLYEESMQDLRIKTADQIPYTDNDFVQVNDNIILNYQVYDGEELLPNFSYDGEMLTVGKSRLPGFDDNLLGMKVGENREFNLTIPEGIFPEVSGKTLKFQVSMMMGQKIVPSPLNDDLAIKVGKKDFAELQAYVQGLAASKAQEVAKAQLAQQLSHRLVADNVFTTPDWLNLAEAKFIAVQAKVDWEQLSDEQKNNYINLAISNVKLSMILEKIREIEPEAQLSEQEILESIKEFATKNSKDATQLMTQMQQNGYLAVLAARIRDEHALDYVLKNCNIID